MGGVILRQAIGAPTTTDSTPSPYLNDCQEFTTGGCLDSFKDEGLLAYITSTSPHSCSQLCRDDYYNDCNSIVFHPNDANNNLAGNCTLWRQTVEEYVGNCTQHSGQCATNRCYNNLNERSSCEAFRFTGCQYPEADADGILGNIQDEDKCEHLCFDDGPCHHYEYRPQTKICILYNNQNGFHPNCPKIIGPSVNFIDDCLKNMKYPFSK